jgi:hypothetical protein
LSPNPVHTAIATVGLTPCFGAKKHGNRYTFYESGSWDGLTAGYVSLKEPYTGPWGQAQIPAVDIKHFRLANYIDVQWCDHGGFPGGSCYSPDHINIPTPQVYDWNRHRLFEILRKYGFWPNEKTNGGRLVNLASGQTLYDVKPWLQPSQALIGGADVTVFGYEYPGGRHTYRLVTPIYEGSGLVAPDDDGTCTHDWLEFTACVIVAAGLAATTSPLDPFFIAATLAVAAAAIQISKDGCRQH